jgi:hypothetical protein
MGHDGDEELLWELTEYSHTSNDKWDMAQVYISAPKVNTLKILFCLKF